MTCSAIGERGTRLSDIIWHSQLAGPASTSLEQGLELRDARLLGIFDFLVWIERAGISGHMQSIRPMEVCGPERNRRSVLDLKV